MRFRPLLAALLLVACDHAGAPQPPPTLAAQLCNWQEFPGNPLIQPPDGETLIGDPTVLAPSETPDGQWHLFANSLAGIHAYDSADGLSWQPLGLTLFGLGAIRPFVLRDGGLYHLFFEQYDSATHSTIQHVTSADLATWSTPTTALEPALPWEQEALATVGNPYVTLRRDGWWLYYSASTVHLDDAGFDEPRYIGVARAATLAGPWQKQPQPISGPNPQVAWRNLGAGSMKLLDDELGGQRIALQNGIYLDAAGHSRSAIAVLASPDGVVWTEVCPAPVLAPHGTGWEAALVYAFDTARTGDTLRLYFNARDGWVDGVERIGLAQLSLPVTATDRNP